MFNFLKRKKHNHSDATTATEQRRKEIEINRNVTQDKNQISTDEDLRPVMFLFCQHQDYAIIKAGWNIPLLEKEDDLKIMLGKEFFFPINESLFIHCDIIRSCDFEKRYVYTDATFEQKMMLNLRGDDVIDKIKRFQVDGVPGCYQVDLAYYEKITASIEGEQ